MAETQRRAILHCNLHFNLVIYPVIFTCFELQAMESSSEVPVLSYHAFPFQQVQDVKMKSTAALRALPVYLHEEDLQFFKTSNVSIQCIYITISMSEVILYAF